MGCQGEIYNVYGITVPAKIHEIKGPSDWDDPIIYDINGRLVASGDAMGVAFWAGIPTSAVDLANPKLAIRILGHTLDQGSRHFTGEALLGYVVANESYLGRATPLPTGAEIVALAPKLISKLSEAFGLEIGNKDLKMFLIFDSLNG